MVKDLFEEIERCQSPTNKSIPIGFNRLNRFIGIRKRVYTTVFGAPGSGKSSFVHSCFILNPYDWYIREKPPFKLKVILFSLERSVLYTLAKWLSRKIFQEEGVVIPVAKMFKWWNEPLTSDEIDLMNRYKGYFEEMMEHVTIIGGGQNPTGIYKFVKDYAKSNGTFHKTNDYTTVYEPNNPNEVVIIVIDHIGLIKLESLMKTKKEAIDKVSEYCQYFRDVLGYTPIVVSQLNRNLNNPIYLKLESFEPTIDDIKESGRPGEDSDVVISLFDPIRYRTEDPKYDVHRFVDKNTGAKHFRSIKVLKNTYGEDDIRIGMAFMGSTGIFKELPKSTDMEGFDYDKLFNFEYYLL